MKKSTSYVIAAGLTALSVGPAVAGTNVLQARTTPLGFGDYEFTLDSATSEGSYVSTDVGLTFIHATEQNSAYIADLEVEYWAIDNVTQNRGPGNNFDRTDVRMTFGYKTPVNVTPFVGYRIATQGEGLLNDDYAEEDGFYVGASYSGIKIGDTGSVTLSAAYNFNTYEVPNTAELDTVGLSAKVSYLLSAVPVAFNLKYQSFSEDSNLRDLSGTFAPIAVQYEETYTTMLSVTWYFWSGVLGQ